MAAYATIAQATEIYGLAYLTIACDRDGNGVLDTDDFNKQLDIATRQMNAYLLGRYSLPLTTPPEHFQKLCTDITVHNCASTNDVSTKKIKDRYDEAIDYMKLIAHNKVKLETSVDATTGNAAAESSIQTDSVIKIAAADRRFTRRTLKELM